MRGELWRQAGRLLAYPGPAFEAELTRCREALEDERLSPFFQAILGLTPAEREELFVRTFDFDPATTLELGWHLYGEDYRRGEFLVQCRQILRRAGVAEGGELPDHAGRLLPALALLPEEEAGPFVKTYVLPALDKLLEALSRRQNPYADLFAALVAEAPDGASGGAYERA
ncbi:MAG: nitrate reductase molybdenum cofactor assembly chaperone [Thermoanaerobaculum sp.]